MAAYMMVLTEITDPVGMEEYRTHVLPVIERYGGRFLAAGPPDVLEGELTPHVAVIVEFPSMERAHAWYDGVDYQDSVAALAGTPMAGERRTRVVTRRRSFRFWSSDLARSAHAAQPGPHGGSDAIIRRPYATLGWTRAPATWLRRGAAGG